MDLLKNIFWTVLLCVNPLSANFLSCNEDDEECKTRAQVVNINEDEPAFFPFSIKISKCSGSCNNINHSYTKICIPNVVKNLNVKVFNLMSITNETRHIEWHETCKCECKFEANICDNKQIHSNNDFWNTIFIITYKVKQINI